jgi:hypothetical protein
MPKKTFPAFVPPILVKSVSVTSYLRSRMGLERTRAFAAEPLDHPNEPEPLRTSSRKWPREKRLAQCLFNARHRLCLAGGAIARPICLRGKRVWQERPGYRIAAGGRWCRSQGRHWYRCFAESSNCASLREDERLTWSKGKSGVIKIDPGDALLD